MTTLETVTMDLADAIAQAGVGGQIQHHGTPYTVVSSHEISRDGYNQHVSTFVTDEWAVVSKADDSEQDSPVVTVAQFFDDLPLFAFIQTPYDTWIYAGYDEDTDTDEGRYIKLWHSWYMNLNKLPASAFQNDVSSYQYTPVKVDGDEPEDQRPIKVADTSLRHALRHLGSMTRSHDAVAQANIELNAKLLQATSDWAKLNQCINEYADETRMCGDYEQRIFGWNTDFEMFKLEGREKEYSVTVRIPALSHYNMELAVKATNPEDARQQALGLSTRDMVQQLIDAGENFYALEDNGAVQIVGEPTL